MASIDAAILAALFATAIFSFRRSCRSTGTDVLLSPCLLSKLLLGSYEEFFILFLAQGTRLLSVDLSPDKAPTTCGVSGNIRAPFSE